MIASKTVYKFANNILKRFETGYDSGTYYLYNVTDDVLWAGNYSCKLLLDLLDGEKNTGELKEEFKNILAKILGDKEKFEKEELELYAEIAQNAGGTLNSMFVPSKDEILQIYVESLM